MSFTSKYAQAIHTFNCLKESNNNKRTNEEKEDENDLNQKLERAEWAQYPKPERLSFKNK